MKCPYCGTEAKWVENSVVYGRRYGKSYMCWWCPQPLCGAYVGCHQNTRRALGTMANKELRNARMAAHAVVDPLWKSGKYSRGKVYAMLSDMFGYRIHIAEADLKTCIEIKQSAEKITQILC